MKVALRWGRLRNGDPEAYARTVVYRDAVSYWRSVRREVVRAVMPDVVVPPTLDTEDRLTLQQALSALTRKQRAVIVLRYLDDLTEAQTAEVLGVSVGTVKSQSHAAIARLRAHLEPQAADTERWGGR